MENENSCIQIFRQMIYLWVYGYYVIFPWHPPSPNNEHLTLNLGVQAERGTKSDYLSKSSLSVHYQLYTVDSAMLASEENLINTINRKSRHKFDG